jgi:hypothetical protein
LEATGTKTVPLEEQITNEQRWKEFHETHAVDECRLVLHTYEHITSAVIDGMERTTRDTTLLLRSVNRAEKKKGQLLRGDFIRQQHATFTLSERTCRLEDFGDGSYYFETLSSEETRIYGFLYPRARLNLTRSETPIEA